MNNNDLINLTKSYVSKSPTSFRETLKGSISKEIGAFKDTIKNDMRSNLFKRGSYEYKAPMNPVTEPVSPKADPVNSYMDSLQAALDKRMS